MVYASMVHVAGGEGGSLRHDPARPRSRRCRLEIEPLLHSLAQRPSPSMRCGSQSKSQGGGAGREATQRPIPTRRFPHRSARTLGTERRISDANPRGATMSIDTVSLTAALVVKLVATPDEADEVRTFLADAVRLANQEQGTIAWFALRTDTTTFWIVDAFPSDAERQEHLEGAIASSLLASAERLL